VAQQHQRLVIGPWSNGGLTGIFPERSYGLMASADAVDLVGMQLRWYDHWLKGEENGVEQDKRVKLFVMGLDQWRAEDDWPLPDTQFRPYYLHSAGGASSAAGDGTLSTEAAGDEAEDIYLYNPRRPVPTVGGAIYMSMAMGMDQGPRDQRSVEAREDVLWATSNVFKAGHRIRLEVTSSNFPRFDRNTNTGGTIETETEKDFLQAVNRVYHDGAHPSHLILPIIERD
jgi:uncharacterized protein